MNVRMKRTDRRSAGRAIPDRAGLPVGDTANQAIPAIQVRGLSKSFANQPVLREVDFEVSAGEIFGYIGPNGAGKSTTVKILVGLLTGFQGEVRVAGYEVAHDPLAVKARPENAILYEALSPMEQFELLGRIHGMDEDLVRCRAGAIMAAFDLESRLHSRMGSLSKGMRQKVLITSALLHNPQILFLDEPLSGLDVNASMMVKDLLRSLADSGRTIFYCSHVMDVVERVCDRIAILDGGKLIAEGSFEELSQKGAAGSLERVFADLTKQSDEGDRVQGILDALV